jgi:hypothetical protein
MAERLRAAVLGPRGGGTTRRRASDVLRLGFAVVVVAVSIPVMRANSAAELSIVRAVHPPPPAISWLVTVVFWLGSAGVSVLLVLVLFERGYGARVQCRALQVHQASPGCGSCSASWSWPA